MLESVCMRGSRQADQLCQSGKRQQQGDGIGLLNFAAKFKNVRSQAVRRVTTSSSFKYFFYPRVVLVLTRRRALCKPGCREGSFSDCVLFLSLPFSYRTYSGCHLVRKTSKTPFPDRRNKKSFISFLISLRLHIIHLSSQMMSNPVFFSPPTPHLIVQLAGRATR